MQKYLKYSSILSYMLKPSHLLTQCLEKNRTTQENIFKHMCNFGVREKWREVRIVISYYFDVETTKDQCRLLNTNPLEFLEGCIMEDALGDRDLKRLHQRRLNCIYGYISSYCLIINSPESLEQISQAKQLSSVLCDL